MYSVLYVDDEDALLEIGKIFLEKNQDMRVDTVTSAVKAMDMIRAAPYDAVVSDYKMPVMDGIEFLKRVRSTYGDTPFILFTGKGREEVVIEAINNGADFYLQKGGDPTAQFAELAYKIKIAIDKKQAEHQLSESRQRMADIINFLPDATFAIDLSGRVIAWNRAIEEMTGVASADIIGKDNYHYALPFYGERRPILIDLVLTENSEAEKKYPFIVRHDRKLISEMFLPLLYGGKGAYLWFTASPLYDSRGRIIGAIESIRDISDFKRSEQMLREGEAKYRGVIESIQDVFYRTDSRGNLVLASPSMATLLGYDSVNECLGKNIADTFYFDPSKRQEFLDEISSKGSVERYEVVLKRKDGSPVTVSTSSHLYYDDTGNVLGVEGIFRDISERKRNEALLEESVRKSESIVQGSPVPTFVIDRDRRIVSWNRALEEYSGIRAGDVIGKAEAWRAFYQSDRPCLADLIVSGETGEIEQMYHGKYSQSVLIDGAYEATDFFPRMKGGTWLSFSAAPIRDSAGQITGAVEVLQDITAKRRAEEELSASYEQIAAAEEELRQNYDELKRQEELLRQKNEELSASNEEIVATEEELRQNYNELSRQETELRQKNEELSASYEQIAAIEEELRQNFDELSKQEAALRENEERYRTIFENTGTAVVLIEENALISLVNEEFVRLSGLARDEIEGKKKWTEFVFPEDLERMLSQHRLRREDRKAALRQYEFRFVTKSGDIRTIFLTIDVIPGTKRSVASLQDISGRKMMEESLKESEQRYRNVVEDQTEFVCRFLPSGTHIFVNDAYCRYFHKCRDEIIGQRFLPDIPEEDKKCVREHFRQLTRENPVGSVDHRIIMPDGAIRWQRWSDRAIFNEYGETVEYQSVGRDVTDMKTAEEDLKQANRKLNLLSSITRHDIINKITVCKGFLALAKQKPLLPDQEELLRRLEKTVIEIQQQIEFTRLYQDLGIRRPVWQNLSEILSEGDTGPLSLISGVDGVEIYADPMLPKMFENLTDNTLRHGERATSISVHTAAEEEGLTVLWEDDGIGVPDREKELIFERGYGKHSGLGLFFVREMLSITGIYIKENGKYGRGVRFEITVPKDKFRTASQE
jgi:PAS domain S-box-containing protein